MSTASFLPPIDEHLPADVLSVAGQFKFTFDHEAHRWRWEIYSELPDIFPVYGVRCDTCGGNAAVLSGRPRHCPWCGAAAEESDAHEDVWLREDEEMSRAARRRRREEKAAETAAGVVESDPDEDSRDLARRVMADLEDVGTEYDPSLVEAICKAVAARGCGHGS